MGCGYTTSLCLAAADKLAVQGASAEVVDLRVLNPFRPEVVLESARKTRRVVVVDGAWQSCGIAAEVIASISENLPPNALVKSPKRLTLAQSAAQHSGHDLSTASPFASRPGGVSETPASARAGARP